MFQRLTQIPKTYPFLFGMSFSTIKTSTSDLLVQTVIEKRKFEEIDWKRNASFATFGMLYLGGVQYALYVPIMGRVFPNAAKFAAKSVAEKVKDAKGIAALAGQVILDQLIHHPLMYFPAFYITKEVVTSGGLRNADIMKALNTYKQNMSDDLLALWKIWIPSTILNFAFMPMWARIPWVASTSLIWTCILSGMRGGEVHVGDDLMGGAVTAASFKVAEEAYSYRTINSAEADPHLSHFVVNASGPDSTGLVSSLANSIAENGGSINRSKMVRLGGEFIMQLHVASEPEKAESMLRSLSHPSLNITTATLSPKDVRPSDSVSVKVQVVGLDQIGILARVAKLLASSGLNVEQLQTSVRESTKKERVFVVNVDSISRFSLTPKQIERLKESFENLRVDMVGVKKLDMRVTKRIEGEEEDPIGSKSNLVTRSTRR
ncbi:hypothetical protein ScalyP_jg11595 [Parmales sp. scaly parma]|nr:hypothetical protein ScalyP_jg11595 [Parmales sp. scaly parma]